MKIQIDHLARIEGHLGFVAQIVNGQINKARVATQEGVRLIEGILRGRHFSEAPIIAARVCGICPVVHNLTSLEALERALGVKVRENTKLLRKLMQYSQIIHSHSLHLFFLSYPDFIGITSDLELTKKYPKETLLALRVRDFALKIVRTIGGRVVHPITTEVGGFKKIPSAKQLTDILKDYEATLSAAKQLAKIFQRLKYPELRHETEFISLGNNQEYAIYEGQVVSSRGLNLACGDFVRKIEVKQKPYNPEVKRASWQKRPYMVGAIARLNNNFKKLNPEARKIWPKNLTLPCLNTFYNILAQAVEVVHCLEESGKILRYLVKTKLEDSRVNVKIKAGYGVFGMEAPRGTLYHAYELDNQGYIRKSIIMPPTLQFLDNLEEDIKSLPDFSRLNLKERRERIRMLIRAYDPCISCATH